MKRTQSVKQSPYEIQTQPLTGVWGSVLLASAVFAVALLMLASVPQSGDGAELVSVALRGGVIHPPGFPLQAWLDRAFIQFPFWNGDDAPTLRLSLLSALFFSGTAFLISENCRALGASLASRALAVGALSFFPSYWSLGVQPEVFAATHFLMALVFYVFVAENGGALSLGALVGACAAQHPIAVVAAPAFGDSAYRLVRGAKAKPQTLVLLAAPFVLISFGLYLSLPALRTEAVWPDWGKLNDLAGILRHALRKEFGTFSLAVVNAPESRSALSFFIPELALRWNLLLLLAAYGFYRAPVRVRWGLGGSLALGLALLAKARMEGESEFDVAILERFFGVALLPLSIFLGLGAARIRAPEWAKGALAGVTIIGLIATGYARVNPHANPMLKVFTRGVGLNLPSDAVYLGGVSDEYFAGVPTSRGLRFPIQKALLQHSWYVSEVFPKLEPRVPVSGPTNYATVVDDALKRGLMVASVDEALLRAPGRELELRGLVYIAHPAITSSITSRSYEEAVKLCPLVESLEPLPPAGHGFSRQLWLFFARAFWGAGEYQRLAGRHDLSQAAFQVFQGLKDGRDSGLWKRGCQVLRAN